MFITPNINQFLVYKQNCNYIRDGLQCFLSEVEYTPH